MPAYGKQGVLVSAEAASEHYNSMLCKWCSLMIPMVCPAFSPSLQGTTDHSGHTFQTGQQNFEGDDGMVSSGPADLNTVSTLLYDVNIPPLSPQRNIYTGIYWLLTRQHNRGVWILNKSPHIHFHHAGGPIRYHILNPKTGDYKTAILGGPLEESAEPQLIVEGGIYKCSELLPGHDYALIGEGVAPGFEAREIHMPSEEEIGKISQEALAATKHLFRGAEAKTWEEHY